jgi:D-beta-D-heptose 7-phosphate kinase / D-beta-D-heptose 1-phosphate adenosyltransferase
MKPGRRRAHRSSAVDFVQRLGARFPEVVLVVGDLISDHFIWGDVERISPEAPVQVLRVRHESDRPGGAANVAMNLSSLGCRVHVAGVVGADAAGKGLVRALRSQRIGTTAIVTARARPTTVKSRVIGRGRQLLRMDREVVEAIAPSDQRRLIAAIRRLLPSVSGIVCSDYAKGVLTPSLLRAVFTLARRRRPRGAKRPPIVVDPKGRDFTKYRGADILTPNESELLAATEQADGAPGHDDLESRVQSLVGATGVPTILVTRGAAGMDLFERRAGSLRRTHIPVLQRHEVYDVTGAGDTVASVIALTAAAGVPLVDGARIASAAAGVVVSTIGTAVVEPESLLRVLDGQLSAARGKILSLSRLAARLHDARQRGAAVVFTNGCFDLLHAGHLHLLQRARALGDLLVVAVNDDVSVRRLKGAGRPLVPALERAEMLAALQFVDYVTLFHDDTPLRLVRTLRPDVLVKGSDYAVREVVGRDVVESYGGRVELVPLLSGFSTSGRAESISKRLGPHPAGSID